MTTIPGSTDYCNYLSSRPRVLCGGAMEQRTRGQRSLPSERGRSAKRVASKIPASALPASPCCCAPSASCAPRLAEPFRHYPSHKAAGEIYHPSTKVCGHLQGRRRLTRQSYGCRSPAGPERRRPRSTQPPPVPRPPSVLLYQSYLYRFRC